MASHELRKFHASGGTYTDTETVLTYNDDSKSVDVAVHCMPGLVYWTRPDSPVMRKWVDELLKDKGVKRNGARSERTAWGMASWRFTYWVKAV